MFFYIHIMLQPLESVYICCLHKQKIVQIVVVSFCSLILMYANLICKNALKINVVAIDKVEPIPTITEVAGRLRVLSAQAER